MTDRCAGRVRLKSKRMRLLSTRAGNWSTRRRATDVFVAFGLSGKRRKGLRVTDLEGRRLSRVRSLARSAFKFIPWELAHTCIWQIRFADDPSSPIYALGFAVVWLAVGVNVLSLLVSPTRRTLYDRLAGTLVVAGFGRAPKADSMPVRRHRA